MRPDKLKITVKEEFAFMLAQTLWDGETGEDKQIYPLKLDQFKDLVVKFIKDNDFDVRKKS